MSLEQERLGADVLRTSVLTGETRIQHKNYVIHVGTFLGFPSWDPLINKEKKYETSVLNGVKLQHGQE